ncbi:SDR family oxidoreductase [Candidatus Woesearchaeota archaeon]|nr:SDR family oxidoreductase [Candidatus Woesearchaeota archaeon]
MLHSRRRKNSNRTQQRLSNQTKTSNKRKKIKTKKTLLENIPINRLGKPEDIARAAVFLASERSKYITGHNLVVDGGWLCH